MPTRTDTHKSWSRIQPAAKPIAPSLTILAPFRLVAFPIPLDHFVCPTLKREKHRPSAWTSHTSSMTWSHGERSAAMTSWIHDSQATPTLPHIGVARDEGYRHSSEMTS